MWRRSDNKYNIQPDVNSNSKYAYQTEMLQMINQYNNTDRKLIKSNLRRILINLRLKPKDMLNLGYSSPNIYAWTANATSNIPMFNQALHLAVMLDFDIKELSRKIIKRKK